MEENNSLTVLDKTSQESNEYSFKATDADIEPRIIDSSSINESLLQNDINSQSHTFKKMLLNKSPSKSLKTTPKKNLLKIKASFTTPKKRCLPEEDVSDELQIKRFKKNESTEEDNNDEGWQDVSDVDESDNVNVDIALEKKANKMKMNAKNVKSIIHHVLTNEHVQSMFRSVVESENNDFTCSSKDLETPKKNFPQDKLDCVPKLTRAKVKDLLEKVCVPSPIKPVKEGPSILDVEFAEEEDDDEYNPEKDEECHESDDDESIVSSQVSEVGSPYPATPTTPVIRKSTDESVATTPVYQPHSVQSNLGTPRNLVLDFNSSINSLPVEESDGVDTIALRTRSKLPLTSKSLNELEDEFRAPDITPDMYDNTFEDLDWLQFLSSIRQSSDDTLVDDDANDPEFNYIAEAEREKPDEEDFRFDKPTQVSKKELSDLYNELSEDDLLTYQVVASVPDMNTFYYQQNQESHSQFTGFKTPQPPPISHEHRTVLQVEQYQGSNNLEMSEAVSGLVYEQQQQNYDLVEYQYTDSNVNLAPESLFTPEQIAQTQDHLRKHIQLLIQSFLLTQGKEVEIINANSPRTLLLELESFRQNSSLGQKSIYNVCNLDPALELLRDQTLFLNDKPIEPNTGVIRWKPDFHWTLTEVQQKAVFNSPAFIYPLLLPTLKKGKQKVDRKYTKFLPSEDNLIALGLLKFNSCRDTRPAVLIHKHLIRGKNANQVHFRIQFMSSQKVGDNPIKCVKKTGKLPDDFPKPCVDDYYPIAPRDQITDYLPTWCLSLKQDLSFQGQSSTVNRNYQVSAKTGAVGSDRPKSKKKINKLRSVTNSQTLNDTRIQTLPTLIVPNRMAQVSAILIQFGSTPNSDASKQTLVAAPVNSTASTVLNISNIESSNVVSCNNTEVNFSKSLPGINIEASPSKDIANTLSEEAPVDSVSPTSPDMLAKTMISCGIQESPNGYLSSPTTEHISTSTPYQKIIKHPTVRNLSSAFDAAHVASIKPVETQHCMSEGEDESTLKAVNSVECISDDGTAPAELSLQAVSGGSVNPSSVIVIENSNNTSSKATSEPVIISDTQLSHSSGSHCGSNNGNSEPIIIFNTSSNSNDLSCCLNNSIPKQHILPDPQLLHSSSTFNSLDSNAQRKSQSHSKDMCSILITDKQPSNLGSINSQQPVNKQVESAESVGFKPSPIKEPKTPTKLRSLAPKGETSITTYTPLPKMSPRRKELNKQVRQILPKTHFFETKAPSPTKTAALMLKKKATMICQQRSPVKILPKLSQCDEMSQARSRVSLTPSRMYTRSQHVKTKTAVTNSSAQSTCHDVVKADKPKPKEVFRSEVHELEEPNLSHDEEDDDAFEDNDQIHLNDLMAASTTIKYDPKKGSTIDTDAKSKSQRKKDVCLAMLEADILECDPKKDERDTAYAQFYFNRVKEVLKDDPERFRKFLSILHVQNKDHCNPIELYADLALLLSDHQDLVDDFAGFLLSFQAVECGCFVSSMEYQQIRTFLRQLEIYCDTSNVTFQRTLKMMSKWLALNQDAQADTSPFRDRIALILRHVPGLMDDLFSYFFDAPMPESHTDDFETVTLDDVYDVGDKDKFEEVTLPEGREDYNTKLCSCKCHGDSSDEKLQKRSRHCVSCSLKMFEGKPILKTCRNEYHDLSVLYPLEEKEKLARAKKEAALLALAKARARRQQKKKSKKKSLGKLKTSGVEKKNLRKRKSDQLSAKIISEEKFLEASMQQNIESQRQKVVGSKEDATSVCDKTQGHSNSKEKTVNYVPNNPISSLTASTYSDLFLPSATSSPIVSKSISTIGGKTRLSSFSNLAPIISMAETVTQPTTIESAQLIAGDSGVNMGQTLQGAESSNHPFTRTKSRSAQVKAKSVVESTQSSSLPSLSSQLQTSNLLQNIPLTPAITNINPLIRFPSQPNPPLNPPLTQTVHARIPVIMFLQPQDSLPQNPEERNAPTKANLKKPRKTPSDNSKSHIACKSPKVNPPEHPTDQVVTDAKQKDILLTSSIFPEPPPSLGSAYIQNDLPENLQKNSISPIEGTNVQAQSKASTSILDLHTSDTSSLFHFSPSKFKGNVPEVVRAYLDNFTLSGFDETMDMTVQHLAQAISPSKTGAGPSKFNLLAFLESSNLTLKDGSVNLGKPACEGESRLSFSGVLSETVSATSKISPTLMTSTAEPTVNSAVSGSEQKTSAHNIKEKGSEAEQGATKPDDSKDKWTEPMDRAIIDVIITEGINIESIQKLHQLFPQISIANIESRARMLLHMLQAMDSESDTGQSCDDSSNM